MFVVWQQVTTYDVTPLIENISRLSFTALHFIISILQFYEGTQVCPLRYSRCATENRLERSSRIPREVYSECN